MKREHSYYLGLITEAFNAYFGLNYYFCYGKNKKELLEIYPFIYYRWISSYFGIKTLFTPYSLMWELEKRLGKKGERSSFSFPYLKPDSWRNFGRFNSKIKTFTTENHPVIEDLHIYLKTAAANGSLAQSELGEIVLKNDKSLKSKLSIYTPYYTEYLHAAAEELGLVTLLPSVNIRIYKVNERFEDFFDGENLFEKIFETSVKICCLKLNELFPDDAPFFSPTSVKELIKKPVPTEELIRLIFEEYEINADEVWGALEKDENELMREDAEVVSSTYFLNQLLSKWFFTVFGYYLNIIRPYSFMEQETYYSMQYYINHSKSLDYNLKAALFLSPPDSYVLTPFGSEILNFPIRDTSPDIELLSKVNLFDTFKTFAETFDLELPKPSFKIEPAETYILKIYNSDKPKNCVYFEFSEFNTLWEIYYVITNNFRMRTIKDYSIFTDESFSPFSEYTSFLVKERSHKKTETTLLNEVISAEGDKVFLRLYKTPHKTDKKPYYDYTAQIIRKGEKNEFQTYPTERTDINE